MRIRTIQHSVYKGVFKIVLKSGRHAWIARQVINGNEFQKKCESEKDAARAIDMKRIECGKFPINIFKKL